MIISPSVHQSLIIPAVPTAMRPLAVSESIWLWLRVVVPSDVFSSECQADAGSGLAI